MAYKGGRTSMLTSSKIVAIVVAVALLGLIFYSVAVGF
jgi:hypothetical protein